MQPLDLLQERALFAQPVTMADKVLHAGAARTADLVEQHACIGRRDAERGGNRVQVRIACWMPNHPATSG